jgi:hypothetical protein
MGAGVGPSDVGAFVIARHGALDPTEFGYRRVYRGVAGVFVAVHCDEVGNRTHHRHLPPHYLPSPQPRRCRNRTDRERAYSESEKLAAINPWVEHL